MEVLVLDTEFKAIAPLDQFESLLWVERYSSCGDFEIYSAINMELLNVLKKTYYLWSRESESTMIIEGITINSDVEEGGKLIVTGRSLESILDRRIIWEHTVLTGNFQNGIKKLLDDSILSPSIVERKIDNFIFTASEDPAITTLEIDAQFARGDNLYEAISTLCTSKHIGFRINLTDDNKFEFGLYSGVDRSYDQMENPHVVFSPSFDNIINSNYLESDKAYKTVAYVIGEGEEPNEKKLVVELESGGGTGITRREIYADARDITSDVDGVTMTPEEYNKQLKERGDKTLLENKIVKTFEGETETTKLFRYGEDFFRGDILQIVNEYGIESKSRVVEVVRSQSAESIDVYPTFEVVE